MSDLSKIAIVKDLLDKADKSIKQARDILSDVVGGVAQISDTEYSEQAANISISHSAEPRVVEGVFNGVSMIDSENTQYPVPANYASKSKLACGDVLKLTITDTGRFIYKQIGPVPRKHIIGPLSFEDGQYTVLAEGRAYKVLLASVTYFKAEIGDEISLLVPESASSEWGAIDAVLPKFENIIDDDTKNNEDEDEDE